jgi:predicted DCC family thiol-disulfide oxidoreductase YuxK
VLLYDGECRFCRQWVDRWRETGAGRIDFEPSQAAGGRFPEIPAAALDEAVHLVDTDGAVCRGAEAVIRTYARLSGRSHWVRVGQRSRLFRRSTEAAYRWVAGHRRLFSWCTRMLWGESTERPRFAVGAWVFLRLLGAIYAIAFLSCWVQLDGLLGPRGILPADDFLDAVRTHFGGERWWRVPTLAWLGGGGVFLHVLCGAGLAAATALVAGAAPRLALALAWVCYLSLVSVGQVFFQFQWDVLLLEAGFAALFLAPGGWWRPRATDPSRIGLWLLKWLLFRLMFLSGAVKLTSGDPTWRSLSALRYHFETQPLPTGLGWWAHQCPAWAHRAAEVAMFAIELGLPFLIVAPRRLRLFAAGGLMLLQVLIALTGNYNFFNLLTLALCVLLLDDRVWPAGLRRWLGAERVAGAADRRGWTRRWLATPAAAAIALLGAIQLPWGLGWRGEAAPVQAVLEGIGAFHLANNYGLFRVMTTERPEIIVQGSADGRTWETYTFKWKPGPLDRRPGWVAPHQPRLDWQMWFAALGDVRHNPWFVAFALRLLEGEPAVLALLADNPFPDRPPRFVRAVRYDYRFTTPERRREHGRWWRATPEGFYLPPVSLSDFNR